MEIEYEVWVIDDNVVLRARTEEEALRAAERLAQSGAFVRVVRLSPYMREMKSISIMKDYNAS